MAINRVERVALDGGNVTIAFGKVIAECKKISYGDALEPENVLAMGSQAISAQTDGTYKVEDAKVTMDAAEFRAVIQPALDANGFGNRRFDIIVGFQHADLGSDSDALGNARFVGLSTASEAAAKALEVEFTIKFTQLYWGDDRKTINRVGPISPQPSSGF